MAKPKKTKIGVGYSVLGDTHDDELFSKASRKEQGQQISGDPTDTDRKIIQAWIDLFEKAYPGQIGKLATDAKIELALSGRTKDYGEISKDSESRLVMWLPGPLQEIFEVGYPSFWTNKKHLHWFLTNFPQFRSAPRH